MSNNLSSNVAWSPSVPTIYTSNLPSGPSPNVEPVEFFGAAMYTEPTSSDLKSNVKLESGKIDNIRSILALIYNTFKLRYNCLTCFFTIGSNENKTCFHCMKSLPLIRFSLFNDNSNTIVFVSDWSYISEVCEGWDIVLKDDQEKEAKSCKAKSVFAINNVSKINIYNWGFEIINNGGIELTAILNYALLEKSENIIGKSIHLNSFPFNPNISSNPDFMKIIASWSRDEN